MAGCLPPNPTVGTHLLNRIAEVGVEHLFGVPGDYNLAFLDQVVDHPQICWIGNANELNAAYAADGYARVSGIAALLTTFGVGELSAMNGIAGSYAEHVPVLHIVGAPPLSAQCKRLMMHHSLGDGDFAHFLAAARAVTVAQAQLTAANAADEIDRVLDRVLREKRPGYLMLPADVAIARLESPATRFWQTAPIVKEANLSAFGAAARRLMDRAVSPAVLAGHLGDRFGLQSQVRELVKAGSFPNATLSMGKGVLDESGSEYLGVYAGSASETCVREAIESADAIVSIGAVYADVLTAGFSHHIDPCRVIDLRPTSASVAGDHYPDVPIAHALALLTEQAHRQTASSAAHRKFAPAVQLAKDEEALSQAAFWCVAQEFLRPNDLIVADQGTSFYGSVTLRLPPDATYIGQPFWASIGYGLPCAFGAQTRFPNRRTIVFAGDGSALPTAQEIGSMLRDDLKPIIFLLNNRGYTVERVINAPDQRYHDIAQWDWTMLPQAMGCGKSFLSRRIRTVGELKIALAETEAVDNLTLLEIVLPKLDVPQLLEATCRSLAARNRG